MTAVYGIPADAPGAPPPVANATMVALWPLTSNGYLVANPIIAILYAGVAALSLMIAIPPGYASALWPPAGIALAAWLAFGARIWPGILIGATLANLGVMGTPVLVALVIGAGNVAEVAIAGLMIRRLVMLRHKFNHPSAVWKFAAIAFIAAGVAATNGVSTLTFAGQVPLADFGTHWLTWWLGDATGIIIVTPLLLCWSEPDNGKTASEKRIEYQLFAALLVLCGALVWAVRLPTNVTHTIAFLMIPLVTWAAARLDQRAVTAASLAISVVAVVDLLGGSAKMFSPLSLNESLLLQQLFVSAVALTGLTLSALSGGVIRVNARLADLRDELERRVKERSEEFDRLLAHQYLLARRMVKIRDEERGRLAADLHDTVAQDLTSLDVILDLIQSQPPTASARLRAEQIVQALTISKRAGKSLSDVIMGRRPPAVEGLELSSALQQQAAAFESRTGILVKVSAAPAKDSLSTTVNDALIRICVEALNNVVKHADAYTVHITLENRLRETVLGIDDDGQGFDSTALGTVGPQTGAGLQIMRERTLAIRARFHVHSAPGKGTRIEVAVPRNEMNDKLESRS